MPNRPRFTFRSRLFIIVATVFVAATFVLSSVATMTPPIPGSTSTVFINEIHYDNTSTDANEGVEIAGPAGTNLTG